MTPTRATVLAALVAALGLTAMTPAFAAGPDRGRHGNDRTMEFRRAAPGGAFRFAEFSCSDRAADRIENRLDRMARRLSLNADQQKLFEEFRTSALTAQTDFADQCDTIRPDRAADADRPDLVERLEQKLKFDEARLAAMTELLPQLKVFYASLTEEQKTALAPRGPRPVTMRFGPGMPQMHMQPGAGDDELDG